MKRLWTLIAIGVLTLPAFAATREWIRRAPLSNALLQRAVSMKEMSEAQLAETHGTRPVVLLETNYYTYVANDPLELIAVDGPAP